MVEDEEALRKVARRTLDAAGYTVLTAANGDEALLTCAQHAGDIHLLLTDVVMPRMSGRTLARSCPKTRPTLKVLYMSGYTDDAIVQSRAGGAGGVLESVPRLLPKPFTIESLLTAVRAALRGSNAAGGPGPGSGSRRGGRNSLRPQRLFGFRCRFGHNPRPL